MVKLFYLFANRSIYAFDSAIGKKPDGKTRIRLGGFNICQETLLLTPRDAQL